MHKPIKILSTILTLTTMMLFAYQTYAQDGTLDSTFTDPNIENGVIISMALQSDGKILISGSFTLINGQARNRIARLNADGTLDEDFAIVNVDATVFAIAIDTDDRILLAGDFTEINSTPPDGVEGDSVLRNGIARLEMNGALDDTFDPNVTGRTISGFSFNIRALALQADGRILIGGFINAVGSTSINNLARLSSDGILDGSFNPNPDNNVNSIVVTPDNQILIGGTFNNIGTIERDDIARLDLNGDLDIGFTPPNILLSNIDINSDINSVALQTDGKVIIIGVFNTINGIQVEGLARLQTNGNLDTDFTPPDLNNLFNFPPILNTVALQRDDKILLGGFFSREDESGLVNNNLIRLNTDGSFDNTFIIDVSANVNAIALQPADDNIIIGGSFTSINGETRNRVARLENDTPPPNQINFVTTTLSQAENNSEFEFLVSRAFPSSGDLLVNYTVTPGTNNPVDADDFDVDALPSGVLTFADGDTMQNISIQIANDTLAEQNETFIVTLTVPDNATLGIDQAQATILDDDEDVLCLPIPATNGNMAVVCL